MGCVCAIIFLVCCYASSFRLSTGSSPSTPDKTKTRRKKREKKMDAVCLTSSCFYTLALRGCLPDRPCIVHNVSCSTPGFIDHGCGFASNTPVGQRPCGHTRVCPTRPSTSSDSFPKMLPSCSASVVVLERRCQGVLEAPSCGSRSFTTPATGVSRVSSKLREHLSTELTPIDRTDSEEALAPAGEDVPGRRQTDQTGCRHPALPRESPQPRRLAAEPFRLLRRQRRTSLSRSLSRERQG